MTYSTLSAKSSNPKAVLEAASDYYKKHDLEIVEVGIGEKTGKYVKKPNEFANAGNYLHSLRISPSNHSTAFTFYVNATPKKEWCYFVFDSSAHYPMRIDQDLAQYISEKLKTITFEYEEGGAYFAGRTHINGVLTDAIELDDIDVAIAFGYFKKFENYKYNPYSVTPKEFLPRKSLKSYIKIKIKTDPTFEGIDWAAEATKRWMKLEGSEDVIHRYLSGLNEPFRRTILQ